MWSVGQDWLVLVFPAHRGGRVAIEGTADGCRGAIEEVKVGEVHGKPWSSCMCGVCGACVVCACVHKCGVCM